MFGHLRAICFDLDDTLWPCVPVIRAAEAHCYAWLQREAPRLTERYAPDDLRAHRIEFGRRQPQIAHDLSEVRLRSLAALLEDAGYPVALARGANDAFRDARNRVTPYPDVLDGLARLRGRYTLVSVTNGNAQIECTPLHASFDLSLTAAEVGAARPDPAMFHTASAHTGVPLEAFLHVGDDPERDVEAARRVGMSTVWVNRDDNSWPPHLRPADLEVHDLAGLVENLDQSPSV
ncbi:MAG: HAD-IA family hydrolase [Chromatiaceae bacterium]|nr:HAD-IA family hydrolase [Chromatiaceae bacterium]MCP5422393.1 HAD-IA family hydrolase [Chromatiaceae bacterium]